ncbi:MAG: DUF4249 domain-containing protein [Bacteroidota bacterium]
MKSLIYPLLLLAILFGSTACEEVIELEVSNGEPVMVIEGSITNLILAPAQVKLSMSGSYFEPGDYPAVEGAEVVLVSSSGERSTLVEESAGIYKAANLVGEVGEAYTLEIESDGELIRTQSVLEKAVPLDSVSFVSRTGGPIEGVFPRVHFEDPAGVATYLRFVVWVNNIPYPTILTYNDNLTDGADAIAPLTVLGIKSGDELLIQAFSLDKAGYDYYSTLSSIVGDAFGPAGQSAAPSNPTSNIEGNAVGYFGAHAVSTISVRVP